MSARPRILLTNFHTFRGGGHRIFLEAMAHSLVAERAELAFATPEGSLLSQTLKDAGKTVFDQSFPTKPREGRAIPKAMASLRRLVREWRPDIVHVNGGPDLAVLAWSHPWGRRFRVVRTHHSVKGIKRDPYHRWLYHRVAQANVYVSRQAMESSLAAGLEPGRVSVLANGVNLEKFAPREPDAALRESLGLRPDHLVVGTCAGMGPYKRVDVMLEALRRLEPPERERIRVLLLGDERAYEGLVQRHVRPEIAANVVYGGFHLDVRPYVALFDVGFLLSDRIETISYATREMLAMGVPVLSSTYGGLRENVREGETGWLVPPGEVTPVVAWLRALLRLDPERRREMGRAARADAVARFDERAQFEGYWELYQSLLQRA
ncbi:MAG: glycosyltransferase family 4 protein [Verrucomicrobiota bacterium]